MVFGLLIYYKQGQGVKARFRSDTERCPSSLPRNPLGAEKAILTHQAGFPGGSVVKNLTANTGDAGSIPGSGRSTGGWLDNPLQYSCLGNPRTEEPGEL